MFDRVLKKIRELVRTHQYVMTTHADEEMYDDALTIRDVENAVVTGQITARQKNEQIGVWKYLVQGRSLDGRVFWSSRRSASPGG